MVNVSVVIPAYNSAAVLPAAIDSVLNQSYRDFKIIVVDDGSTDDTKVVLEKYKDRATNIYQKNQGSYKARNTGILAAESPYIAFLDADDIWLPDKLERQIKLMESDSRLGLVFSDADFFGGKPPMIGSYWKQRGCYDEMISESRMIRSAFAKLMKINFILPSTALVKKACFEKAGFFDESLRHVGDKDMWLRVSMYYPMACIPVPLVKRCVHAYTPEQVEKIQQSIIYVVLKMQKEYPEKIETEKVNVRSILGPLYYTLGRIQFDRDLFNKARKAFGFSFRNRPSVRAALLFLVTLFGSRFVQFLRAGKRGILKWTDVGQMR